jgi:hypothetical protein
LLQTVDTLKEFIQTLADKMNEEKLKKGKYIPSELTTAVL